MSTDAELRDARLVQEVERKLSESRRATEIVSGYEELITGMFRFIASLSELRDLKLLREGIDDRIAFLEKRKEKQP